MRFLIVMHKFRDEQALLFMEAITHANGYVREVVLHNPAANRDGKFRLDFSLIK